MAINPGNLFNMASSFYGNLAGTFQGALQQTQGGHMPTIGGANYPGLGLNASAPQPPTQEQMNQLSAMQQQHSTDQENFLDNLGDIIDDKKEQFFEQNHYVIDSTGHIAMDSHGSPLVQGGRPESADERMARRDYERQQKESIQQQQAHQNDQLQAAMQSVANAAQNPANMSDPQRAAQIQAQEQQLQDIAANLAIRQKFQLMTVGCQNVPGVSDVVTQGAQMYKDLVSADTQAENNSPAGQAMAHYTTAMTAFVQQQQASMAQLMQSMGGMMGSMLSSLHLPGH